MDIREIGALFAQRGGKRLRPRLCREVYESILPRGTADLSPLQEALESFHKASLVHDDIQDNDTERYNCPTVWKECGIPTAIAVGDWMFARGYALIARTQFPRREAMLVAASEAILALCEGQGDELTGVSDFLTICQRKTGALFALSTELGALAANADPKPYHDWGIAFGVLFQIRDDLADKGETAELLALQAKYEQRLSELPVGPFLVGRKK